MRVIPGRFGPLFLMLWFLLILVVAFALALILGLVAL